MPAYALGMMVFLSLLVGSSLSWQSLLSDNARINLADVPAMLLLAVCAFAVQVALKVVSKRFPIREKVIKDSRLVWLVSGVLFFLVWEIALLSHYPGIVTEESMNLVVQSSLAGVFTNQPPLLYKLLLSIPLTISRELGNQDAGVAIFLTFQVAFLSGVVGYSIMWLRRKGLPIWLAAIVFSFLGLNPLVISYAIGLQNAAPLAACILLLVIILYDSMQNQANALRDSNTLFKLVCLGGVLILLKSAMIIVVVPLALFLILYVKEHRAPLIIFSGFIITLCFLLTGPIFVSFNPEVGNFGLDIQNSNISDTVPFFSAMPAFGDINPAAYWDIRVSNPVLPLTYAQGYQPTNLFGQWFNLPFVGVDFLAVCHELQNTPVIGFLFSVVYLLWAILLGFTVTLANRPARYCVTYLPLLALWVMALLTNLRSEEMPILFAFYFCFPIALLTPFVKSMDESKSELRKSLVNSRKDILPIDRVAAEQQVADKLFDMLTLRVAPGSYIGVYSAFNSEMAIEGLLAALQKCGYRMVYPVVYTDELMTFASFEAESAHSLTAVLLKSKPNFITTQKSLKKLTLIPPRDISALIVPGVGFDLDAMRLGYGGGYYDRYLKRLDESTPVWGIAFDEQIVEKLPSSNFDAPMTAVITPPRYFAPK